MDRAIKFNKIYLIHSIPDGEYSLTNQLESRILPEIQSLAPHIRFESFHINTAEDLNDILDTIANEIRTGDTLPLIQFDMHGGEGFFLTSTHSVINFDDISEKLSEINRLSRFNLLLFIVSCEGASFIAEIMPSRPSPCWGIVSSTRPFVNVDASNFIDVYRKIAAEERGWSIIDTLNDEVSKDTRFSVFTGEEIFKTVFKFYIRQYTSDPQTSERAASMQAKRSRGYADIDEYMKDKNTLADTDLAFNHCKKIFFMFDDIPENIVRFPLMVHDIYDVPIIGAPSPNEQE